MSFYLKPPTGNTFFDEFDDTCRQRIKFYEQIFTENMEATPAHFEYIIEDSRIDRMGHNLFRFAALSNELFYKSFLKYEVELLNIRLNRYSQEDLKNFLKILGEHGKECQRIATVEGPMKEIFDLIVHVCRVMLEKNTGYIEHAFKDHTENCKECDKFKIEVPYHHFCDLFATRDYEVRKGFLCIYPFQWKILLVFLFKAFLQETLREMASIQAVKEILEEDRTKLIVQFINWVFSRSVINRPGKSNQDIFRLHDLGEEADKFPLCMQNLYDILRKTDRLGHRARFDFTVYLKTLNMPMDNALTFWKNIFSKEHSSCAKCSHSWEGNEKKYNYNIRHIYGKEGAGKSYTGKSCHQIQSEIFGANDEGGCPFTHSDDVSLRRILKSCLPASSHDKAEVIIHERKRNAKKACKMFLAEQLEAVFDKDHIEEDSLIYDNPAEYYSLINELASEKGTKMFPL